MGVEIRGMDRLRRKLNRVSYIAKEATVDAVSDIVDLTQTYAVQRAQSNFKHPTGELAQSIQTEIAEGVDGHVRGSVFSNVKQAIFTEFGTGPVGQASPKDLPPGITPVYTQQPWFFPVSSVDRDLNAEYGMLIVKIQEVEFYMTRGQPARPWLYPALKDASKEAPDIIKDTLNKYMKEGLK